MKEQKKLVYISVNDIFPHADNPRKELGDLSELADSIREKGIMQNLTVVRDEEFDGLYTVIIGHRRLEAAKLAGLSEVPCVIADMTPKEQIATMLLENMQRSDLTVYEQAQGFQMMFDFGESVESISKKTGFSESTVRRRLKMAELDSETLKEVSTRQISLLDFDRLYEIKDEKARNSVLCEMGTNNFEFKLSQAIRVQEACEKQDECRLHLARYNAIEIPLKDRFNGKYSAIRAYISLPEDPATLEEWLKDEDAVYFCFESSYVHLLRDKAAIDADANDNAAAERKRAEAEKERRKSELANLFRSIYELRHTFVKSLFISDVKKHFDDIIEFLFEISCEFCNDFDYEDCAKLFDIEIPEDYEDDGLYPVFESKVKVSPYLSLLFYAYSVSGDNSNETCFNYWDCKYCKNRSLIVIYTFLKKLGYEMSDEEIALMDGTHELYVKDE